MQKSDDGDLLLAPCIIIVLMQRAHRAAIRKLAFLELSTHPCALQWYFASCSCIGAHVQSIIPLFQHRFYRLSADELLVAAGCDLFTVKFSASEGTLRVVSSLPRMHEVSTREPCT